MKTKLIFCVSVCFVMQSCVLMMINQPIKVRMWLHWRKLKHVDDEHKIHLNGVYYREYYDSIDVHTHEKKAKTSYLFTFKRYFANGKVYCSQAFGRRPTDAQLRDTHVGKLTDSSNADWTIYYVRRDILYEQDHNGYNGYFMDKSKIDSDGIKLMIEHKVNRHKTNYYYYPPYKFLPFKD